MVPITYQSIERAYPQSSLAILGQRIDGVIPEFRSVRVVERSEAHAIKSCQPKPGADPQVAIARLFQARNTILRKALVRGPAQDLVTLIQGSNGIGLCRRQP